MDVKIFNSDGRQVAIIHAGSIFDLKGQKLYDLRGLNIHKTSGELVGHLSSTERDQRLDTATDKLFSGK